MAAVKIPVSTEGRVFVAQLCRDVRRRQREGAGTLTPGALNWTDAFRGFGEYLVKSGSPTKAAKRFAAGRDLLRAAQRNGACFVNCFMTKSRSGFFECLVWEVAPHPLTKHTVEGIVVKSFICQLQRNGRIAVGRGDIVAYISWHALARMKERSKADIFLAGGVVAGCGMVGLLMRESSKHIDTAVHYAIRTDDTLDHAMICAGVLRLAGTSNVSINGFYDVFTVLPFLDQY